MRILFSSLFVLLTSFFIFSFTFFSFSVSIFFLLLIFILAIFSFVDIRKGVALHLFLVPIVNINFLISDLNFSEYLFYGWERKGVHFDGVALVLLNSIFFMNWIKGKFVFPKQKLIIFLFSSYILFHLTSFVSNFEYRPYVQIWGIFEQLMYLVYLCGILFLVERKENLYLFLISFLYGVTFSSALIVGNMILLWMGIISNFEGLFVFHSLSGFADISSLPGPIPHRHYFSSFLLLSIPLSFYLLIQNQNAKNIRWIVCSLIQLIAFSIAHSKGAMLGIVICFLFIVWKMRKKRFVVYVGSTLLSIVVILPTIHFLSFDGINSTIVSSWINSSVKYRKYILLRSFPIVKENIWLGTGIDSFKEKFLRYEKKEMGKRIPKFRKPYGKVRNVSAHNFYLMKLVETGVGGILMFLFFIFTCIYKIQFFSANSKHLSVPINCFISSSLIGLCFFALTEDIFTYSKVMVFFVFVIALGLSSKKMNGNSHEERQSFSF